MPLLRKAPPSISTPSRKPRYQPNPRARAPRPQRGSPLPPLEIQPHGIDLHSPPGPKLKFRQTSVAGGPRAGGSANLKPDDRPGPCGRRQIVGDPTPRGSRKVPLTAGTSGHLPEGIAGKATACLANGAAFCITSTRHKPDAGARRPS